MLESWNIVVISFANCFLMTIWWTEDVVGPDVIEKLRKEGEV